MGFQFEDLDDAQFERLVLQCIRKLFGQGVQGFSTGKDGGRDARFNGTAERFPSSAAPWSGLTVGQAKHTAALNAHFSEPGFSSTAPSSVLSKEIERLRVLREAEELDFYILFSNRRLGGVVGPKLEARVAEEVGIDKSCVHFVGHERLNDLIAEFPEVVSLAGISFVDGPLLPSSQDLAEVILAIADELKPVKWDMPPTARVHYDEKNQLNAMSDEFAEELSRRYLSYTEPIQNFLAAPENEDILRRYEAAVEDFQLRIIAKREDHQTFDDVFNHLVDVLVKRDPVLSGKGRTRLVRLMLFYMYWHCDIGKQPDALPQ